MLHIHEDVPRRRAAGSRPKAVQKAVSSFDAPSGKSAAPPKPRRALGDITNKGLKAGHAGAGSVPNGKQALKADMPARAATRAIDGDIATETCFPAEPSVISIDPYHFDLDACVETVLAYRAPDIPAAGDGDHSALDELLFGMPPPPLQMESIDGVSRLAPAPPSTADLLGDEMGAGCEFMRIPDALPETVGIDATGCVADTSDDDMQLDD